MNLQIHLMRHGRSALPFPANWITPAEFREWIVTYNQVGIADDSHPPEETIATARGATVIVCSDHLRSIESAARLAPDQRPRISPLFREVGRPLQRTWNIRLPLMAWGLVSVWLWNRNLIIADESVKAARARAQEATKELITLAKEHSRVLFVGHGMLNAMIGRALLRDGWHGPARTSDENWGVSSFQRAPGDRALPQMT